MSIARAGIRKPSHKQTSIEPVAWCKLRSMKCEQPQAWQRCSGVARFLRPAAIVLVTLPSPGSAQDIRGLEACTAEKQMDRRTGCLQANVEFLQQALIKLAREAEEKIAAADRNLAA